MANDGERLALLDEIEHLERLLDNHPSWKAWRALDSRVGLGRGPEPKTVGALVGGFAMDLAQEPAFVALLSARDRLRRLAGDQRGIGDTGRASRDDEELRADNIAAVPLRPAPSFGQPLAPEQVIDAEFAEANAPIASRSQPSLIDRIANLEQETTTLIQRVAPTLRGPDPLMAQFPLPDEAEVIIEVDEELPAKPAGGLVSRLESMSPVRPAATGPGSAPAVDEADVDIVIADDEPQEPPRVG